MSCYLERLATSARNPPTRIAPLVRPLYLATPADPEPPGSSLEQPDDVPVGRARRTEHEPRGPREPPRPASAAGPSAQAPAPAAAAFEPLLAEPAAPDVVARARVARARVAPARVARARPVAPEALAPQASAGEAEAVPPAPAEMPDAAADERGRTEARPETSRSSLAPHSRLVQTPPRIGPESPRALEASPRGLRAPDVIQIHIGRVEVAALAPPEPQPASPPRERSGLRLADYLRTGG